MIDFYIGCGLIFLTAWIISIVGIIFTKDTPLRAVKPREKENKGNVKVRSSSSRYPK